jgi:hypothetical protein
VVTVAVMDRTYQASDLAGTGRREFLDRAKTGEAHLRDTDGTPLVMVPAADLDGLRGITAWVISYLGLETALQRPRDQRQPSDFGQVAWAATLDEDDLTEMRDDLGSALVVAASQRDPRPVETLMRDWRYTAISLADPVSGPILRGGFNPDDFVEVARPSATP